MNLLTEGIRSKQKFHSDYYGAACIRESWGRKNTGLLHRVNGPAICVWIYDNEAGRFIRHHIEYWFDDNNYSKESHPVNEFVRNYGAPFHTSDWDEETRVLFTTIYAGRDATS